jgi:hypothetical protein
MEDDDLKRAFRENVDREVERSLRYIADVRDKLAGWGFSPTLDKYVWDVICASGYRVSPEGEKGSWTAKFTPQDDGKFDRSAAREAVAELHRELEFGLWSLHEGENHEVLGLATRLSSAAAKSLETHGDLRDAVNELSNYVVRGWNHPNEDKKGDLYRVLHAHIAAREEYENDVRRNSARATSDADWLDERLRDFQSVALLYVRTPNAHTPWLTNEISASLLQTHLFALSIRTDRTIPATRIGATMVKPWNVIVPLTISALLFLVSVAFVIVCYVLVNPTLGYGAAGLCALFYFRRLRQSKKLKKERARFASIRQKTLGLYTEVKNGAYNLDETIRRFREINAAFDDFQLPTIFVSVIAVPGGER